MPMAGCHNLFSVIWLSCAIFVFMQMESFAQEKSAEFVDDEPYDTSFVMQIHPSLSQIFVHLQIRTAGKEDEPVTVYLVELYDSTKRGLLQVIQDTSEQTLLADFDLVDANLDGFLDFRFVNWVDMASNESYHYWLFDNRTNRYEFNKKFSELLVGDVEWRPESKTVVSTASIGCVGRCEAAHTFQVLPGDLLLVEEAIDEEEEVDGKWIIVTKHYRLMNGKMQLVK